MPGPKRRVAIGAHEVALLRNGDELFPEMLATLDRARSSVELEMFCIGDDEVGRAFRAGLVAAARRGVRVRVIADALGSSSLPRGWFDSLKRAGAQVQLFRPVLATLRGGSLFGLLARDHRKVLVVDDRASFVGGLNLSAEWAPCERGGGGWRDTAIAVAGPELPRHLRGLFDETWARVAKGGRPPERPVAWATDDGSLGVLANKPGRREGHDIRRAYIWALRHARRTVDITCAYFAPRRIFVGAIRSAVERGVRVRLLLPLSSDVWIADFFAGAWTRALSDAGVEIYGYTERMLHAKTAIVDGQWLTVGSHNLDALSWAYNLECNVFVHDERLAGAAEVMFDEDLRAAVPLPSQRRGATVLVSSMLGTGPVRWAYALPRSIGRSSSGEHEART